MTDGREIAKGTGVFMSFRGILFSLIFLGASLSGAEADKNAALERMREARAGTLIRGYLREKLANVCAENGIRLVLPEKKYCTDNAAMIAEEGVTQYLAGNFADLSINACAHIPLGKKGKQ